MVQAHSNNKKNSRSKGLLEIQAPSFCGEIQTLSNVASTHSVLSVCRQWAESCENWRKGADGPWGKDKQALGTFFFDRYIRPCHSIHFKNHPDSYLWPHRLRWPQKVPGLVVCTFCRSDLRCTGNGVTRGKCIPVLSRRPLFSKANSNWLKTIIESHLFLSWLISFLFLFYLHVCWKQKRGERCHSWSWLLALGLLTMWTPASSDSPLPQPPF